MDASSYLPKELYLLIVSLLDDSSRFSLSWTSTNLAPYVKIPSDDLTNQVLNIIISDVISKKYVKLFKWMETNKFFNLDPFDLESISEYLCEKAAATGSFEILKYITESCFDRTDGVGAGEKWMASVDSDYDSKITSWVRSCKNIISAAASNGDLEIMKWIYVYFGDDCLTSDATDKAAKYGNIDALKWLITNKCDVQRYDILTIAVRGGHLNIVKYLHENIIQYGVYACLIAAENGHLEILKYLHKNEYYWDESCWSYAALNGHMEVLQYLRENGCPG